MTMNNTDLQLNCDTVECKPITIDWGEALGENMEGWQAFEAFECDECGRTVVVGSLGECEHRDIEPEIYDEVEDIDLDNECGGYLNFDGPQMNYWYPVDIDDPESAALTIADLPLCVVVFEDGASGLALTGGGTDLSWEICRAFIALGYLPPLHFCDLPDLAGMKLNAVTKRTLAACKQTTEVASNWALGKFRRLVEIEKRLKKGAA